MIREIKLFLYWCTPPYIINYLSKDEVSNIRMATDALKMQLSIIP